jgi:hypothetical protein
MQAEKFFQDLKLEGEFSATDGWLWHWQKHHGIGEITISGEAKSCDTESAKQFLNEFQSMCEGYCDEQLYNCDESALFYRMLHTKSLDLKSAPNKAGLKLSKDRVTLLFCLNKAGTHKLPPLLIGKSKNLRCFKSLNRKHLPIEYASKFKSLDDCKLIFDLVP